MNILNTKAAAWGIGIIVGGAVLYFISSRIFKGAGEAIGNVAKSVGTAINPVSDQNLAYRGVGAVGAAVTGDQYWTLGGAIYDLFHTDDASAPSKQVKTTLPIRPEDRPTSLR